MTLAVEPPPGFQWTTVALFLISTMLVGNAIAWLLRRFITTLASSLAKQMGERKQMEERKDAPSPAQRTDWSWASTQIGSESFTSTVSYGPPSTTETWEGQGPELHYWRTEADPRIASGQLDAMTRSYRLGGALEADRVSPELSRQPLKIVRSWPTHRAAQGRGCAPPTQPLALAGIFGIPTNPSLPTYAFVAAGARR
jgi:hypothetical protein